MDCHLHFSVNLISLFLQTSFLFVLLISCSSETPPSVLNLVPTDGNFNEHGSVSEGQTSPDERFQPPYFSSPVHLTSLAQTEQFIYEALAKYELQLKERLQILQRYRSDYEDSVIQAVRQNGKLESDSWTRASVISSHPLLAYRMIHRFTKDLQAFTDHIWQSLENELWETLETTKGDLEWPSASDMIAATKTLIRLQDAYDFDLDYFTDGVIRDYPLKVGITAKQSLDISQTALSLGDTTAATEWFQAAHSKAVHGQYNDPHHNSIPMDELTYAWETTYKAFREIWPMTIFKTHDVFAEAKFLLRQDFNRLKIERSFEHRAINFKALCRGDKLKSDAELAHLICFNDRNFHPYLHLIPLKVEIHNWEPLIYQVHEFLGAWSMHEVSLNAVSTIAGLVQSGLAAQQQAENDAKTFTYGYLFEEAIPTLSKLTKKVSKFTGLKDAVENVASYHISAFGVGNHYEPCTDCFDYQFESNGSENHQVKTRATVHAVLHEPELGGEFAFTLTGTLVKPSRGSLIIYNNMNPSTKESDERILHGSCPVLIGQKWIATRLISVA